MYTANPYAALYREKLATAEDAVAWFADGGWLIYGTGQAEPPALLWAFANRLRAGDLKKLRIFSSLPMQTAMDSALAPDLVDTVERCSGFVGGGDRGLPGHRVRHRQPEGQVDTRSRSGDRRTSKLS